nr:xaa-Pro dipeptidase [Tanacetum cinerariifolium]
MHSSMAMMDSSSSSLLYPPPSVSMNLHIENRQKLLNQIRHNLTSDSHGFILLQGGEEQTRYCTDHEDLFRQESYFAYLFGVREPGFYGAIDINTGKSILFAPRLPAEYAVWMGEIKALSHFKETYMVDMAYYTDEITEVLNNQYQGSGKPLLYLLHGLNTDSKNFSKPAEFEEYQLESVFLHHTYFYGSCRHCSYTCICATGDNSSVLHYGHAAAPNDRTLRDGDMALLDMGAEFHFYASDITCSFPVNGKFTSNQRLIYNAVLDAHDAVISSMKPGVNWVDMHKLAEKVILQALKKGSLLVGDVDEMMVERLGSVFMPHGLGHLMGLDTHDPGGYLQGAERPKEAGLRSLRTSRDLIDGMVITVEPGCYFIDALLVPAMESSKTSKFFIHEEITKFRGFGGVRIESDLYVTSDGCVNMTKVPRKIEDVEAVMGGASWPIKKSKRMKLEE